MKYQCFDGIDRDAAIDEYIRLEQSVATTRKDMDALQTLLNFLESRRSLLSFNELGAAGIGAMREHLATKQLQPDSK